MATHLPASSAIIVRKDPLRKSTQRSRRETVARRTIAAMAAKASIIYFGWIRTKKRRKLARPSSAPANAPPG